MQSYFPDGAGSLRARTRAARQIPMEPEPIYARKKGARHEVVATYDTEFRAGFDRKITDWAIDFMTRSHEAGQALLRVPALHPGTHPAHSRPAVRGPDQARQLGGHPDPDGRLHRPRSSTPWTELGIADDTIVVWASDNGAGLHLPGTGE